ncbi:hypothetical protein RUND412_000130 [Rhizina undulata]
MPPQTPPAMFALKAFRTAILGTPAPPKVQHQVRHRRSRKKTSAKTEETFRPTEKRDSKSIASAEPAAATKRLSYERPERPDPLRSSEDSNFAKDIPKNPIPFKISKRSNLFDRSPSPSGEVPSPINTNITTPVKAPPSPTKGILLTPGATLNGRKKTVSFHKSVPSSGIGAQDSNSRIRSGLPHEYPGKFPSPWTPRTATPGTNKTSSLSNELKPEEKTGNGDVKEKQPVKRSQNSYGLFDIGEDSRIDDYLEESDNDKDSLLTAQDAEVTSDMDAPKSASGKFWKERTETLEDLAVQKLEKLRTRCKIATGYAKKKDELCVDLGEKLREVMETNSMLKAELKRLHQNPVILGGEDSDTALRSAMSIIDEKSLQLAASHDEINRMQTLIGQYEHKLGAFQEMLDQRENELTEMSMSLFANDEDENLRKSVEDLKKKLRKANAEIREMKLTKIESNNLKSRVEGLDRSYAELVAEKEKLECELKTYKEDDANKSASTIRSSTEQRLRQQIEALEKAKRELRQELRNKAADEAKEKRETERRFRAEMAEIKSDLTSLKWDKEKANIELQELNSYVGRVEKELEKAIIERDEFRKKAASFGNGFWEKATAQELKDVKQEKTSPEEENEKKTRELDAARRELDKLKTQRKAANPPASSSSRIPGKREPEVSGSDDSALDRSFDRTIQPLQPSTSSSNFRNPPPNSFSLSILETPNQSRTNIENSLLPSPPPVSPAPTNKQDPFQESSFYRERQKKASPRASMVSMAITPPAAAGGRKVSGVGRVVGRNGRAVANMDPAKRAAAEKRLAERKKARAEQAA